jgi:Arc/MetJ-type ribon-helix-helix transcriptional regulator
MKTKSFRLQDSDVELLEQLAEERGESQSDVIRFAIQNAANVIRDETPNETSGEVVSELIRQLKVKDEQIAALNTAIVNAQETAKAAQVLQAQSTIGDLPPVENEKPKKKSLLQRLFP